MLDKKFNQLDTEKKEITPKLSEDLNRFDEDGTLVIRCSHPEIELDLSRSKETLRDLKL